MARRGRAERRGAGARAGLSARGDVRISAEGGGLAVGVAGQVTVQAAAPRRAELPHQVGVVPSRAASFQARAEAARLRAVESGGTAVLCQVLMGTGGVGKTQLAADFAHQAWEEGELDVLVWVTAASRSAIVAAYAQAGAELCGADPADPERAAGVFLAWLRAKRHRWLVVLDDVADPGDLTSLWPPDSRTGRTLVTTRRRDAALTGTGRRGIDVGVFSAAESAAYLAATLAAHDRTEPDHELAALADDLGHLPLALSQAAAYLADQGLTVAAYRALLADRTRKLAHTMPASGGLPDDQRDPVAATWSLSLDLADRYEPRRLARPLLALASMLDPNGVPEAVLTSLSARKLVGARGRPWRPPRRRVRVTGEQVRQALRVLHRLSLIDHSPESPHRAVRVHALIQRTTRDTLGEPAYGVYACLAAQALLDAWPDVERDTAFAQALRANTASLAAHTEHTGDLYRPDAHFVLFKYGTSLGGSGQPAAARDYYEKLTAATTRHLGPDHDDTFSARNNLAQWQGQAGDVAGALAAFTELVDDAVRTRGRDHVQTLITRNNLANCRGEAGDAAGAVAEFTELLHATERKLGPDHIRTFTVRGNLARWQATAGDHAGAMAAFTELLADITRVLGPDHPHALTVRDSIAHCQGELGDPAGAAAASAELLEDMVRVLGPDLPRTLSTRNNLAHWRGLAGDAAGAAAAYTRLLEDQLRILGPDHPNTRTTRTNLLYWQERDGGAARTPGEG